MTLTQQVTRIYQLLGDDRIQRSGLLDVGDDTLRTPVTGDLTSLFTYRSKRPDELIEQSTIIGLINAVQAGGGYKGINHIGFCYKVASREAEVERITKVASDKGYSVYQEPSIDDAAWIFVGDISEITNPLLELLPHEGQTDNQWIDYWLPHIQFDIDTGRSAQEIEALVKRFIDIPFTPYSIKIDGVTYIQRVNLGCVEGVNLMLDLSTNRRDITYRRTWAKLA